MSPLKNTDKHLSDFLPPALVKDWRQCFRSRSALLIFLLLELAGWLLFFCIVADTDKTPSDYLDMLEGLGKALFGLSVFALVLAIPYRAGSTVAHDTRVQSANFLMLTPLSARRIVWGTWSSTALILLLAALVALPLPAARQLMLTAYPHVGVLNPAAFNWQAFGIDALILAWVVLCGWAYTAFYMFAAGLPRVLRGGLIIIGAFFALGIMMDVDHLQPLFCLGKETTPSLIPTLRTVVDTVLLIILFLELARRHYAAPAENCSRSVRLLAPLPLLLYALLTYFPVEGFDPEGQLFFGLIFMLFALLADALLPSYTMPAHAYRLWRGLPSFLQKPGIASASFCLALGALCFCLPGIIEVLQEEPVACVDFSCGGDHPHGSRLQHLLHEGLQGLNFSCSLLLCLLITDCLCSRSAWVRPLAFGLVALVLTFVVICLQIPLDGYSVWEASLPTFGTNIPYSFRDDMLEDLYLACGINGGALLIILLLLIFWRARVKKA